MWFWAAALLISLSGYAAMAEPEADIQDQVPPGYFSLLCGDRTDMLRLPKLYGEEKQGIGIVNENVMEMYLSPEGTWTLLITMPDNTTCLYGQGSDWVFISRGQGV